MNNTVQANQGQPFFQTENTQSPFFNQQPHSQQFLPQQLQQAQHFSPQPFHQVNQQIPQQYQLQPGLVQQQQTPVVFLAPSQQLAGIHAASFPGPLHQQPQGFAMGLTPHQAAPPQQQELFQNAQVLQPLSAPSPWILPPQPQQPHLLQASLPTSSNFPSTALMPQQLPMVLPPQPPPSTPGPLPTPPSNQQQEAQHQPQRTAAAASSVNHKGDLLPDQYDPDSAIHYILNGVNPAVSQETLKGLLSPYGVTRVHLVFGRARRNAPVTSLGFAYVDFATPQGAKAAIAALNGSVYFGSELKLHVSRKDRIK